MNPGQILIVSDDSKFVQSLTAGWKAERDSPSITAVSVEVSRQASPTGYEIVVVGPLRQGSALLASLTLAPDSLVCVVGDMESLKKVRPDHGNRLLLPDYPGWMRVLFSIAREVARRTVAEERAREAELTSLSEKRFGVLGKSLLEARPGMINALTSLLGNADLILLSDEELPANCRENVRTIHRMALRLNEVVQRLSSLENELELSERKSHLETSELRMAETSRS
ncbi:MAG TPA: hypothetical protein VGT24_06580 [Candidatus Acidoferrales bacterium]|nr:hypothetical protein [Candidatus Acidoferrales bacterium]